jgi:FkbM family methyltransferase
MGHKIVDVFLDRTIFLDSSPVRRILEQPPLKPLLSRLFYATWKLVQGDIFRGEINGVKMLFYDPGGPETYWYSFYTGKWYEHSVVVHMRQIAEQFDSPVFLDVGAHYGYYTVYMSKLAGSSGKVFSFEPNSEYFKVLSQNVRLNQLRNVSLRRVALSDRKGKIVLVTSQRYLSMGLPTAKRKMTSLGTFNSASETEYSSPAVTFDEMAKTEEIRPDIIKIDVHGAEGNVIAGMKETLQKNVKHLYCELHDEMCNGYTIRDIIDTIQDAGMRAFEFHAFNTRSGRLTEISRDLLSRPGGRMVYAQKMDQSQADKP